MNGFIYTSHCAFVLDYYPFQIIMFNLVYFYILLQSIEVRQRWAIDRGIRYGPKRCEILSPWF